MTGFAVIAALSLPGPARAQVSVNPNALSKLQAEPAAKPATATPAPSRHPAHDSTRHSSERHPPEHHAAEHHAPDHHSSAPAGKPPAKPSGPARPPAQAPAPPPPVTLAPSPASIVKPPPPPPPVPIVPDAAGTATPIPNGVRITFADGKSDLNPVTDAALQALAQKLKADPNTDLNIYAYAAGVPDDPSGPRRLSLSRALAARAVLINQGIASTRIYPRALGATPSDGPPDHVDIVQDGPGSQPPPTPAAAPKAAN